MKEFAKSVPVCHRPSHKTQDAKAMEWTSSELERRSQVEAGETVLANKNVDKCLVEWAKSEGIYVFIGRPGRWRNPFKIGRDGDRNAVLSRFQDYFETQSALQDQIEDLKGKVLGCYCYPEPCHGHQLIEAIGTMTSSDSSR